MDPTAAAAAEPATAAKASAIPRPLPAAAATSKLPLSRFRSVPPKPPQQTAATQQPPAGRPAVASGSTSAALTKSTQAQTAPRAIPPPSKPGTARTGLANASRYGAKPGAAGVASHSRQPKRTPATNLPKSSFTNDFEEDTDHLTSLDTFRSTSSQSSRLGFRSEPPDDSPLESLENAQPGEATLNGRPRKSSRPSLSDRTIGSLQNVPSTPKERRRSSFFNPVESPMGPPPRPGSGLSRNESGSNSSRPGTSDGTVGKPFSRPSSPAKKAPASAQPASRTTSRVPSLDSTKRSISGSFTSRLEKAQNSLSQRTVTPAKQPVVSLKNGVPSKLPAGGKTIASSSRPTKPRPALGEAFNFTKKPDAEAAKVDANSAEPKRVISNSSAALRQQIAAAKAAARMEKANKRDSPQDLSSGTDTVGFEEPIYADPFNQAPKDEKHILRNRVNAARMDGKLNIAAMGLKQIPDEVLQMYSSAAMEESKVNWAEVVDLTKLVAADNEFEQLDDAVFPDVSPEDLQADDSAEGNQFGGLEVLDLHGNALSVIPMGLRRLERLAKLDIAHNKLDNAVFEIVSQITSLKELRLAHNGLTGNVPSALCGLTQLETLDLQANRLLSLPEALRELLSLKVLNVSGNQLTTLPMDALHQLPLTELHASGNALIASLFPLGGPNGHPTLQALNVANNSLAALTFMEPLDLPQLRTLDVTNNQMTVLPAATAWSELVTLLVGDNKVTEFPQGFTSLRKLRNANFSSNEIRLIDPDIGRMPGLESLILASNPLREKKFLTMNAADIKRDLKSRLALESEDARDCDEPASPVTVIGDSEGPPSIWYLKGNGVLDLASNGLSDDLNDTLGSFLSSHEVRILQIQSNKLSCMPSALSIGQVLRVLDLSDNVFNAEYLSVELELSSLQELNLSKCRIAYLEPLITQLEAPNLRSLNISTNRLSGPLPVLKRRYPALTSLFASDNRFTSINVDALRGLNTVNLDSNDIEQLPAEIGLLWDEGLRSFEVGRNAFRVPNYRILDKGTQATLRWLRDRLPASGD